MSGKIIITFTDQDTRGEIVATDNKDAKEQIEILKQLGCTDIEYAEI